MAAPKRTSGSISAEDTFTEWVVFDGVFDLSISGTWVGTITVQRSFDGGTTPIDVEEFVENIETFGTTSNSNQTMFRIGIKTGNFTSGTAVLAMVQ